MPDIPCPCSPDQLLASCCGRYHQGDKAPDAPALMRSRYSAFVLGLAGYIRDTTHPSQQDALNMEEITAWSNQSRWLGLQVHRHGPLQARPPRHFVEFTAHWQDASGKLHQHHEYSIFTCFKGRWYFMQPE